MKNTKVLMVLLFSVISFGGLRADAMTAYEKLKKAIVRDYINVKNADFQEVISAVRSGDRKKDTYQSRFEDIQLYLFAINKLYDLFDEKYSDVDVSLPFSQAGIEIDKDSKDDRIVRFAETKDERKEQAIEILRKIKSLQSNLSFLIQANYSGAEIEKCIIPMIIFQEHKYLENRRGIRGMKYVIDELKKGIAVAP